MLDLSRMVKKHKYSKILMEYTQYELFYLQDSCDIYYKTYMQASRDSRQSLFYYLLCF